MVVQLIPILIAAAAGACTPFAEEGQSTTLAHAEPDMPDVHLSEKDFLNNFEDSFPIPALLCDEPVLQFKKIALGMDRGCAIDQQHRAWCWPGASVVYAEYTQKKVFLLPELVQGWGNVQQVVAGPMHACALQASGAVECFGGNGFGQIAPGDDMGGVVGIWQNPPKPVAGGLSKIAELASGTYHVCARNAIGAVYCWGQNQHGQVGIGSMTDAVFSPQPVKNLGAVKHLAAGDRFNCATTADAGALFCWGQAIFGISGSKGQGGAWGVVYPSYVPGLEGVDITQMAFGQVHLCVLSAQKTVHCWGYNDFGQCGQPFDPGQTDTEMFVKTPKLVSNLPPVRQLSGGWRSTCALLESGEVMCWGHAEWNELGVKSSTNIPQLIPNIKNAMAISSGWAQTCAIIENGAVACWGNFPYTVKPSSTSPQCMTFK